MQLKQPWEMRRMPLMKSSSKKAFSHNVGAEMNAGKPKNQSLAIAYSIKRKGKKMAKGGQVPPQDEPKAEQEHDQPMAHPAEPFQKVSPEATDASKMPQAKKNPLEDEEAIAKIMLENRLAKGGMVSDDSEVNAPESYEDDEYAPNNDAFLSAEGDDEYEPLETSMDNEEGHEEEDQQKSDIVSNILKSIRMRNMGNR